jgi:hypothetical protein
MCLIEFTQRLPWLSHAAFFVGADCGPACSASMVSLAFAIYKKPFTPLNCSLQRLNETAAAVGREENPLGERQAVPLQVSESHIFNLIIFQGSVREPRSPPSGRSGPDPARRGRIFSSSPDSSSANATGGATHSKLNGFQHNLPQSTTTPFDVQAMPGTSVHPKGRIDDLLYQLYDRSIFS